MKTIETNQHTNININPFGTVTITSFNWSQNDINNLDHVDFYVSGTGTGSYEFYHNGQLFDTRTLIDGWDQFQLVDIPIGTHTYCANTICKTVEIQSPLPQKYLCGNGCTTTSANGIYDTQIECQNACIPTHALRLKLSTFSWADYSGLEAHLPALTLDLANVITLNGYVGWKVIESRLEGDELVLYLRNTTMPAQIIPFIPAALATALTGITLSALIWYGFWLTMTLTIVLYVASPIIEVFQTEAETKQMVAQELTNQYSQGKIDYNQYTNGMKVINTPTDCFIPLGSSCLIPNSIAVLAGLAVGTYLVIRVLKD